MFSSDLSWSQSLEYALESDDRSDVQDFRWMQIDVLAFVLILILDKDSFSRHPHEVSVLDRLGRRRFLTVLHKQHVRIPQALLQEVPEDFLVVTLLLFPHYRIKRQFLVSFVVATHRVIVVQNNVWLLNLFAAFCFHSG